MIVIARCHTQIFVGVVTYIGAYRLLSAYYLSTYCYKRIRLLTRFYGMVYCIRNYMLYVLNYHLFQFLLLLQLYSTGIFRGTAAVAGGPGVK